MFQLKDYQQRSLDALRRYFRLANDLNDADTAFYQMTGQTMGRRIPYNPVPGLDGLPYVCVRIPTGGGKTYVAAHAVGLATKDLLGADQSVILWMVPTTTILEQTLEALKAPTHPYRRALEREAPGGVRVMNLSEALEVNRATLDAKTTVIVSTMQAFRVDDTEGRKVYEDSGALMDHFEGRDAERANDLECFENGQPKRSLANVLALRRPIVIVDEAHHARTELSFETLSRFRPSSIIEFTATPHREDDRRSNVLVSVSAAELKAEEMIKLPIELTVFQPWKELLELADNQLATLDRAARDERNDTGEYIRPVMLIKAEAAYSDDSITVDVVEKALKQDLNVPDEEIAIATGASDDLEDTDILDPTCPIRYVITIQKLGEGWDCPFAYVLCSVAAMRSNQAVEQMVGRVLRMPNVKRKRHSALNKAYAFAADDAFADALNAVRDVLVENGFERLEAEHLVHESDQQNELTSRGYGPLFDQTDTDDEPPSVDIEVREVPDLTELPADVRSKVTIDASNGTITYRGSMDDAEREALKSCFRDPDIQYQVDQAQQRIQQNVGGTVQSPADKGEPFEVPKLVVRQGDAFETFRKTHFIDTDWTLSSFDATLPDYEPALPQGQRGEVDTGEEGSLSIRFLDEVRQQLSLLSGDHEWKVSDLVIWLDRNIPHQDIRPQDAVTFLERLVQGYLIDEKGFSLDALVRDKYRLKRAVEHRIDEHRSTAHRQQYDHLLFGGDGEAAVTVNPDICFRFTEYPYASLYDGEFAFCHHYYGNQTVGHMNNEEAECAFFLDRQPEIEYWVRNLEQNSKYAFWLQTSTDKFYPDFVCKLKDGRVLVVEYKGANLWSTEDAKEKRNLGQVWAERSGGHCLFVMPKGPDRAPIKNALSDGR